MKKIIHEASCRARHSVNNVVVVRWQLSANWFKGQIKCSKYSRMCANSYHFHSTSKFDWCRNTFWSLLYNAKTNPKIATKSLATCYELARVFSPLYLVRPLASVLYFLAGNVVWLKRATSWVRFLKVNRARVGEGMFFDDGFLRFYRFPPALM